MDQTNRIADNVDPSEVVERPLNSVAGAVATAEHAETKESRILELIQDLLSLGKLSDGSIPNEDIDRSLSKTRDNIRSLLRTAAGANVVRLPSQLPEMPDIKAKCGPGLFDVPTPPDAGTIERIVMQQIAEPGEETEAARSSRILIAEDDPTSLAMALAQVGKLGYRVDGAVNGAEAVDLLRDCIYDLVLMDCQMPVMDGYEATRRIRQSTNSAVPIIAVTAHVLPGDLEKCTRSGMNGFLPKPLSPVRLAATIAKWCPQSINRKLTENGESKITEDTAVCCFDSEGLLGRLMGDIELTKTILSQFLADFPSQLHGLQERFFEGDGRSACLQAHALKGSSATVGANGLWALAQTMETAAGDGELDDFGELLPRVAEEFKRFECAVGKAGWLAKDSN